MIFCKEIMKLREVIVPLMQIAGATQGCVCLRNKLRSVHSNSNSQGYGAILDGDDNQDTAWKC